MDDSVSSGEEFRRLTHARSECLAILHQSLIHLVATGGHQHIIANNLRKSIAMLSHRESPNPVRFLVGIFERLDFGCKFRHTCPDQPLVVISVDVGNRYPNRLAKIHPVADRQVVCNPCKETGGDGTWTKTAHKCHDLGI